MMESAEPELICDFAEVYHIYDYTALPCSYAATLAAGLGAESRVKMKMTGARTDNETFLLAVIADRLGQIAWMLGDRKKRNRPKLLTEMLVEEKKQDDRPMAFDNKEELDRALARFKKRE